MVFDLYEIFLFQCKIFCGYQMLICTLQTHAPENEEASFCVFLSLQPIISLLLYMFCFNTKLNFPFPTPHSLFLSHTHTHTKVEINKSTLFKNKWKHLKKHSESKYPFSQLSFCKKQLEFADKGFKFIYCRFTWRLLFFCHNSNTTTTTHYQQQQGQQHSTTTTPTPTTNKNTAKVKLCERKSSTFMM